MRDLSPVEEREFRAQANRATARRRIRAVVAKYAVPTLLLGAVSILASLPLLPSQPDIGAVVEAPVSVPDPRPLRMFESMSADSAMAVLARTNMSAAKAAEVPQYVGTLQDTWLNAFYGDRQRLRQFIEHTAEANGLPVDFFLRLLQQESGLDHRAVSRAGAKGVAQFMPATAAERGLIDPFDPFEAIPKAAEFLQEQRTTFGSLGMAAAAYNAGPQRVRNWLAGRRSLPQETRAYVIKMTGRSADEWRQSGDMFAHAESGEDDRWR